MIRLIFHGSPMVDEKTLVSSSARALRPAFPCHTHAHAQGEHKVKAGDVVHMIMQMRGGRA
jgi:hypothetical protein